MLWTVRDLGWHTDNHTIRFVEVVAGSATLEVREDDSSISELVLFPGLTFGFYPRQLHRVVGGDVTLDITSEVYPSH